MTPPPRLLAATMVAAVLAVIGGCGTVPAGEPAGAGRPDPAQPGIACVGNADADDGYCDRFMEDLSRRTPLTAGQTRSATSARTAVARALSGDVLNRCNVEHEPCDRVMAWAAQPATPQHVTSRLATIGTDPEARRARPDDPATAGSVLFGVHIGPICVYGHQRLNKDPDQVYAAGPLPHGTCLSP